MSTKPTLPALLLLLTLMTLPGAAQALCLPLACTCSVSTTTLAFGSYNPLAYGNTDSSGSVRVTCAGVVALLVPYDIALSAGGSGSFTTRRMSHGAYTLNYNLYTDNSYTTVLGNGVGGTQKLGGGITLDALGLAPPVLHWVYGRLPGRQLGAAPGAYSDSLTVTLTYY
jgi:spore coat protein U-like protein